MRRMTPRTGVVVACILAVSFVHPLCSRANPAAREPGQGFLSPTRYVNAFFGFVLQFPPGAKVCGPYIPSGGTDATHLLCMVSEGLPLWGLSRPKVAVFMVAASKLKGASMETAKERLEKTESPKTTRVQIGGKDFWKTKSRQRGQLGKTWLTHYITADHDYLLEFLLSSSDRKRSRAWERSIESISFIDPAKAAAAAGPGSHAYKIQPVLPQLGAIRQLDAGSLKGNTYSNETLGFLFQFPKTWQVLNESAQHELIQAGHQTMFGDEPGEAAEHKATWRCTRVLLWVRKAQDSRLGKTEHPAVVISAFDGACVGGSHLPKSIKDREAVKAVGQQMIDLVAKSFPDKGTYKGRAFMFQGHLMFDISAKGRMKLPGRDSASDWASSIVLTEIGKYWLEFMFLDDTQSAVDQLRNITKVQFFPPERQP